MIDRLTSCVEQTVTRAVKIIAAGGRPTIDGILESVAIKDGIKATFKVSQFNPLRHDLIDSQGKVCLLVVANPEDLKRLGVTSGDTVKVTSSRGSLTTAVTADAVVPPGTVSLPWNLGEPSPSALIDATAAVTEVRVETTS